MALCAIVFRRLMHQMAVDAVSVMRRVMRIGAGKILCFLNKRCFRMSLRAGFFCRKIRILEIGSVAGLAGYAFGDVFIGAHFRCVGSESRAGKHRGKQTDSE